MPHFNDLPSTIHDQIIAISNLTTWSLVSRQYLALTRTSWVKAQWLAHQYFRPTPAKHRMKDIGMTPPRCNRHTWDNAFQRLVAAFEPLPPRARGRVLIPHNPDFLNMAVLKALHSGHPRLFRKLREFLLCHVAFWYKEQETCFMLSQGAPVDYALGWVLARFACREDAYHRSMISDLIYIYGARVWHPWEASNGMSVLFSVMVQHNDQGDLAKRLLEHEDACNCIFDDDGKPLLLLRAVKYDNIGAVRFLLDRLGRKFAQEAWTNALYWSVSLEMMKMLVEEYGAVIDSSPLSVYKSFWGWVERCESLMNYYEEDNTALWEYIWGTSAKINEGHIQESRGYHGLHEYFLQRAPPTISWNRVFLLAIYNRDILQAADLLDAGLCSVHTENDAALRSACVPGLGGNYRQSRDPEIDLVKLLVTRGANIGACQEETLRVALQHGLVEVVEYLLLEGADLENLPTEPWLWMHVNGLESYILLPLPHGADVYVSQEWNGSPIFGVNAAFDESWGFTEALFTVLEWAKWTGLSQGADCRFIFEGRVLGVGKMENGDVILELISGEVV